MSNGAAENITPAEIIPPCEHRGEQLKLQRNKLCGCDARTEPIYKCAIHGRCSIRRFRKHPPFPTCLSCPDLPGGEYKAQKLIIRSWLSVGDVVTMTAAIRELHCQYQDQFVTDVRTPFPDLWANNPYVTPIEDDDQEAQLIQLSYSDHPWYNVHRSNQHPVHIIECYAADLARQLQLPHLRITEFKGDIHLSDSEKGWISRVHEVTGRPRPYWIINAGVKHDFTVKQWPTENYQEVIDRTKDRITWIQVGHEKHDHPRLEGVIDAVGKTSLRELVRMVYNADGILTPISALVHLSAAIERPPDKFQFLRPTFIIAGGREPVSWFAYRGQQVFHTVGALDCCKTGGCWKARRIPRGDGDKKDSSNLCKRPVDEFPECMRMITPDQVIAAMENYL